MLIHKVGQTRICSDPEAPVSCGQERMNLGGRQLLAGNRTPWNDPHTIKSEESGVGSYPNVPIVGLCNGRCHARKISAPNSPRRVAILRDTASRIERVHPTRGSKKENCKARDCACD